MALSFGATIEESKRKIVDQLIYAYSCSRSGLFTAQSISLPLYQAFSQKNFKLSQFEFSKIKFATQQLLSLLKKDSENIALQVYPLAVLKPEPITHHLLKIPKVFYLGMKSTLRSTQANDKNYSQDVLDVIRELPEYYLNQLQDADYLSKESAQVYDHQLEVLCSGSVDAMRRLLLPQLHEFFPYTEGEGLRFLEVGCATGRLTKFVSLMFPKAKIIAIDLSYPYLEKARSDLKDQKRVEFLQADAAELPFADVKFDAVFSSFLFHELPLEIRKRVLQECFRVLKPNGFLGLVDSLQNDDLRDLHWPNGQPNMDLQDAIYKNYMMNSLDGMLSHQGIVDLKKNIGFLSKAISGRKPFES